jgi:beta-lactamase regulating signal transducer with metallopeptidase domain
MSAFEAAIHLSESVLGALARASLQGALLIMGVWLLCRLMPRLPAAVRCGLWWLACLHLLLALVWTEPVRLPLLPAPQHAPVLLSTALPRVLEDAADAVPAAAGDAIPTSDARRSGLPVVAGLWLVASLVRFAFAARQLWQVRRIVRRSEPLREPRVREIFAGVVAAAGLRRPPDLRGSFEITTPQVVGPLSPVVLLPRLAPEQFSPEEISMTLCHEVLHVRRGDLWLGWVPAVAQRLFFFHPLAALAVREYMLAREAACDAEVLRLLGTAPRVYGRLLLRLGVTSPGPRLAAVGASPSLRNLKRRLEMLHQSSENPRRPAGGWWIVPLIVLAGVIPYRIVAQDVPASSGFGTVAKASFETPRTSPKTPKVPEAPIMSSKSKSKKKTTAADSGGPARPYVIAWGDSTGTMNAPYEDIEVAKRLQREGEGLVFFRRDGKSYVIRDQATVKAAHELFRHQIETGARQAELYSQQAELSARQAELGSRQAALAAQQASLTAEQARRNLDEKPTADLKERMKALERQQDEIVDKQDELSRQINELLRQQDELSRRQVEMIREAELGLAKLFGETIANGLAQEVRL